MSRILLLAFLLVVLAPVAFAADCKQEVTALKTKIGEHGSPSQGAQQHDQGWYAQGVPRAKELLFNASRLAANGKDANCKQLVAEAQRTLGLMH